MLLTAITLGLAAQAAQPAAAAQPVTRDGYAQMLDRRFANLDGNGDGELAPDEVQAAVDRRNARVMANARERLAAQFARLDANSDGSLSLDEWQAGAPKPRLADNDPDEAIERLDSDEDGTVTRAEYRDNQLATFDRLDSNGDGQLTVAERRAGAAAAAPANHNVQRSNRN
ncbi:EF-hand domain-containing protein [Sphingomicrobium arenosum]|uniref:hypothetical protein n=1 Tax=Sphingomicrobium arenosum TaxID=2233861 RepID=UPI0022410448|nr:hypothetical protein [Sphingomicrobium arenosum]